MKTTTTRLTALLAIAAAACLSSLPLPAQKRPELAPSPPMGWNSWNWFGPKITEAEVIAIIDAMVATGLRDAGYNYIIVDGGWREDFLDANGALLPSADRFPRGIKSLSDYAHSKGFKFGLHVVPGRFDCRGNQMGGYGHEETHLKQYLEWKLDFIKLDQCWLTKENTNGKHGWNAGLINQQYAKWSKLLRDCGRDILLSASNYSYRDWYPALANMGRTTGDIQCRWQGGTQFEKGENPKIKKCLPVMTIADQNNDYAKYAGHGYWNDPDMLSLGDQGLTDEEQKAHFALWCIMTAPLMLGNDPRPMTPQELALITNKDLIAINQDPTEQGIRISAKNGAEIWLKKLRDNACALLLLNRNRATPAEITMNFKTLNLPPKMQVRDLYAQKDLGPLEEVTATFPARGSLFIKITPAK